MESEKGLFGKGITEARQRGSELARHPFAARLRSAGLLALTLSLATISGLLLVDHAKEHYWASMTITQGREKMGRLSDAYTRATNRYEREAIYSEARAIAKTYLLARNKLDRHDDWGTPEDFVKGFGSVMLPIVTVASGAATVGSFREKKS